MENNNVVIGIDLGTTNSCVGIWRNNNLEIIPDKYGNRTMPSIVAFTNKSKYTGYEGKNQLELNPENTFYEVKRLIGKKYDDISIKNDMEFFTFGITCDDNNNVLLKTNLTNRKKTYMPEEISAMVLLELKLIAEDYIGHSISKTVITVPAYFNDSQREATKDAAKIAGLDCIRIINEPTAAALAYGLELTSRNRDTDMNVLVYDFGGGTLDCSILNISDGLFEVLGCSGNTHMGGTDFDNRLLNYCINYFKRKYKIEKFVNLNSISIQKLRKCCENAKKILSIKTTTHVLVKDFYNGKNLYVNISRDQYNNICKDLLIMCLKPIDDVLNMCNMDKNDIDEIILVGGSTRMLQIRENIKLYFNGKIPNSSVNPDEVVAAGAAIQGYIIENKTDPFSESVVLLDVIPLSLGIETIGGVMTDIIPLNSNIPITKKKKFTTITDNETSLLIRIFEGERKMTKDNFLIGEFELSNIDPAPRGIPQIEICFSVDVNGIITVSATDLINEDNKNAITITSNKGRLSNEQIQQLIIESEKMETIDKIDREKKQYFYEIDELCNNIKYNINNTDNSIKDVDKQTIINNVTNIYSSIISKDYKDIDMNEYISTIKLLKDKYSTLVIKIILNNNNVKEQISDNIGTSIFGKDDDNSEDDYMIKDMEDDFEFKDLDTQDREELLKAKNNFIELCYCIFDIIATDDDIDKIYINDIKDFINDALLWMHVKEKLTVIDYNNKIDEINSYCNELFSTSTNIIVNKSYKNDLEQLCYALKSSIVSNLLSADEQKIKHLDQYIDDTLSWLVDLELKKRECELNNNNYDFDDKLFNEKIEYINNYCNSLYNDFVGTPTHLNDLVTNTINNMRGTNIETLKQNFK
jgi:heat shock 70kDa protein 1/2/6/8